MISNVSGGPIAFDGPVQLGVFVSSGVAGKTATATFDSIAIGAPQMRYKTSWVGNTFGSREEDKHVSNAISAMWVAPDGTCYTSSYWDEGGRPVTSYRDGRAARGLPIGTPQTAEGAITGDATHLFVAAVDRIIQLDPAKPDFAPQPLCLSVNLLDKEKNHSVVSGLASDGRRLFVADSRENLIRIVSVAPDLAPKKYHVAQAANDGVILAPQPVVVPPGDPRLAPAIVYQTQRGGEGNRYTLPGFTPGREYTVRGHFVEYVDRPANCDPRNRFVVVNGVEVRVAELAGGVLKPLVKDFPGAKADANGNVIVTHGAYGGPGICGFEILDADGKRLFAINCGGPPVGRLPGRMPGTRRPGVSVRTPRADGRGQAGRPVDHPARQRLSHRRSADREVQGRGQVPQARRHVHRPRDHRRGQPAGAGLRRRERPAAGGRERAGPERQDLRRPRLAARAGEDFRREGRHLRGQESGAGERPVRRRRRAIRRHLGRGRR